MEGISFLISEKTLFDINSFLREHNDRLITSISKYKKYDGELLNDILPPLSNKFIKKNRSELSDKERCMARLWKGGYGGRCQNARKNLGLNNECEFCNVHHKEIMKKGKLRYGRIDEISPFRLPKNPDEPYKRCIHISNNKQCKCRMSENSNYCTLHKKTNHVEEIAGISIDLIK